MGVWSRVRMLFNAEQQKELLLTLRRGLVDVATAKRQLERESKRLESRIPQLDDQARRAIAAGREDLARVAIERKWLAANEIEGLTRQIAEVDAEEQRLEAEVKLKESLAGVSGELAELGMAVGRAEEKAERLKARARAIDSLVDLGSFPQAGGGDFVEAELLRMTVSREIDAELERIRELG